MNWLPAFREPWAWGLLAAAAAGVVLLYFLKLRRTPVEIPSTYLWLKTLEDLHVNSLLQRIRNSLLLWLQLLALLLALLALLRPGVRDSREGTGRLVFLLDTSASMSATDVGRLPGGGADAGDPLGGGPEAGAGANGLAATATGAGAGAGGGRRFDEARRRIAQQIDAMTDGDSAMIVAFNDRAEVLQSFTSDRGRLRDALSRARPTYRRASLATALRLTDGLAGGPVSGTEPATDGPGPTAGADPAGDRGAPAELLLFSDGGFGPVPELDLVNLTPRYHAVGNDQVNNLAITAFSADRSLNRPGEVSVVATVANLGTTVASSPALLLAGDRLLDASSIELPPGDQAGLSFRIAADELQGTARTGDGGIGGEPDDVTGFLELVLEAGDDLAVDNRAYAGLTPPRMVRVLLVSPGNRPLELGMQTPRASQICQAETVDPAYLESDAYRTRVEAGIDDLIIFDRCSPESMPGTDTFFIGALPPDGWRWAGDAANPVVVDMDRTHPLLRFVDLFSLLIYQGRPLEGPPGAKTLVAGDTGPLLSLARRDTHQDLVLGFEILSTADDGRQPANTTWYAERSWPVFVLNVLRSLAGASEAAGAASYRPGETVRLRGDETADELTVRRISGPAEAVAGGDDAAPSAWQVSRSPVGGFEFAETELPGFYLVASGDRVTDAFAINLFDRQESELRVPPVIDLGDLPVAATAEERQRREYWRWLLLAMLGVLVAEWWVYGRRVG